MDNLDETNNYSMGAQTMWEMMRMQETTLDQMYEDVEYMTDAEFFELKEDVAKFEETVTYPYIIKLDTVDIHLDEKSLIRIPHDPE